MQSKQRKDVLESLSKNEFVPPEVIPLYIRKQIEGFTNPRKKYVFEAQPRDLERRQLLSELGLMIKQKREIKENFRKNAIKTERLEMKKV